MNNKRTIPHVAFIVGAPRSGTTVLSNILNCHPKIRQWFEPYFVWDRHFRLAPDDVRRPEQCAPKILEQITNDFYTYQNKLDCELVIDKSPRNSLKIPFILKIFPNARFIHIVRDGRDVTLSIYKEWEFRKGIFKNQRNNSNYFHAVKILREWLDKQPTINYKARALWHETCWHVFQKAKHLHRLRWKGEIGWGPQFEGWEKIKNETSQLQFNAYQWRRCVQKIKEDWSLIPVENRLELRYETLISKSQETVTDIIRFLGFSADKEYLTSIPALKSDNSKKWIREFSIEELREIEFILTPMLLELGYEKDEHWLNAVPLSKQNS